MKAEVTLLIAEDHPVYRDGLRQIIASDASLKILGETGNGLEAQALARTLKPDIAILDMDLPGRNGLEIARALQQEPLDLGIIFLTMYREEDMLAEAMQLGAKGYVLKESAAADILQSIRAVARGEHYVSPSLSGLLVKRAALSDARGEAKGVDCLTPAERRILKLVASDKTSKEIAEALGLSPRTVDNHRANMSAKLGLQGSHSLLKFAFENKGRL